MKTVWNWIRRRLPLSAAGGRLRSVGELRRYAFVGLLTTFTGVMCAIIDKTLSSNVGFKGIFRRF